MNKTSTNNRKNAAIKEKFYDQYVDDIMNSVILEECLKIHRSMKLNYIHLMLPGYEPEEIDNGASSGELSQTSPQSMFLLEAGGLHKSASGSSLINSSQSNSDLNSSNRSLTKCIQCSRKVCPSRYASHLANCMGRGRYSSRRALQRIEEQRKLDIVDDEEDDEEDEPDNDEVDEIHLEMSDSNHASNNNTVDRSNHGYMNGILSNAATGGSSSVNMPDVSHARNTRHRSSARNKSNTSAAQIPPSSAASRDNIPSNIDDSSGGSASTIYGSGLHL